MPNSSLIDEKAFDQAIRFIIGVKYGAFVVLTVVAAFVAYSDYATTKLGAGASQVARELVSGILAALLISLVYDFAVRRQEAMRRELELRGLLRELSRQTFVGSGFDDLSDPDVDDLSKLVLSNERFKAALVKFTAERRGGYGKRAIVGLLNSLWSGSPNEFQKWETRLLRNANDLSTYFFQSEQRFAWSEGSDKFRVILTQKAIVGANIINFDGKKYDGMIALPKLDQDIASQFAKPEHHKLTIAFEDTGDRPIELHPTVSPYHPPVGASGPDLEGTEVFVAEFDLPLDRITQKGRVDLDWYWKSLNSIAEPFCYIHTESLCFVRAVTIEYAEISELIGRVWVAPFLNEEVKHDRSGKRVTAEVNGPMMPGHGIALMWDPKPVAGHP